MVHPHFNTFTFARSHRCFLLIFSTSPSAFAGCFAPAFVNTSVSLEQAPKIDTVVNAIPTISTLLNDFTLIPGVFISNNQCILINTELFSSIQFAIAFSLMHLFV